MNNLSILLINDNKLVYLSSIEYNKSQLKNFKIGDYDMM